MGRWGREQSRPDRPHEYPFPPPPTPWFPLRQSLEGLAAAGVRLLALRCAGYDRVDLSAAARLGLRVTRVPTYSPTSVAEHAVALALCLNRSIHRAYARTREGDFELSGLVGNELGSKTVGIVGTGAIGSATARIAMARVGGGRRCVGPLPPATPSPQRQPTLTPGRPGRALAAPC